MESNKAVPRLSGVANSQVSFPHSLHPFKTPSTRPQSPPFCPGRADEAGLRLVWSSGEAAAAPGVRVLGRLGAEVPGLPLAAAAALVFDCWKSVPGFEAVGEGWLIQRPNWILEVGEPGRAPVVFVLDGADLEGLLAGAGNLKRLLNWYKGCLGAGDAHVGWIDETAAGRLGNAMGRSVRRQPYRMAELQAGVRKVPGNLGRLRERVFAEFLHGRGAHLVLTDATKKPSGGSGWLEMRPPLREVIAHIEGDGLVGVVPWSLGLSVLDVDLGNWGELASCFKPLLVVQSRKPGRAHLYFRDVKARGSSNWVYEGSAGQMRSASGYVTLWQGLGALAGAVWRGLGRGGLFPFEALEVRSVRSEWDEQLWNPYAFEYLGVSDLGGSTANRQLFDRLREWGYRQPRPGLLDAWLSRVLGRAEAEADKHLAGRLSRPDILRISCHVGMWIWVKFRHGPRRFPKKVDPEQQRRRIAVRWQGSGDDLAMAAIRQRNLEIGRLGVVEGVPWQTLGFCHSLGRRQIFRIMKRFREGRLPGMQMLEGPEQALPEAGGRCLESLQQIDK